MYIHSSDERSIQTVRGNKIDGLKINQYSEDKKEKGYRIGGWKFYMESIEIKLKKYDVRKSTPGFEMEIWKERQSHSCSIELDFMKFCGIKEW